MGNALVVNCFRLLLSSLLGQRVQNEEQQRKKEDFWNNFSQCDLFVRLFVHSLQFRFSGISMTFQHMQFIQLNSFVLATDSLIDSTRYDLYRWVPSTKAIRLPGIHRLTLFDEDEPNYWLTSSTGVLYNTKLLCRTFAKWGRDEHILNRKNFVYRPPIGSIKNSFCFNILWKCSSGCEQCFYCRFVVVVASFSVFICSYLRISISDDWWREKQANNYLL